MENRHEGDLHSAQWHKSKGKCCACGGSLTDDKHINMVLTRYKATWKFPTGGNVLKKTQGVAAAILCDDCIDKKNPEIKFCIEYQGNAIVYHPVAELEKLQE